MTDAAAAAVAKPTILAERFKTKMCKNWEKHGECPYEWRCMFAHGDAELRTKQMNIADDLVTEDAIKAFQKAKEVAAWAAAKKKEKDQRRAARRAARQQQHGSAKGNDHGDDSDEPSSDPAHDEDDHVLSSEGSVDAPSTVPASVPPAPSRRARGASFAAVTAAGHLDVAKFAFSATPGDENATAVAYDTSKYVSPLAAAMRARKPICTDACHCDRCRTGQAHHTGAILLA